jgi:glucose/arabinose dehydrogenase
VVPVIGRRAAAVATVVSSLASLGFGSYTGHWPARPPEVRSLAMVEPPLQAVAPPVVVASGLFAQNLALDARGGLWAVSASAGDSPSAGVSYVPPGGGPVQHVHGLAGATALVWSDNRLYVAGATKAGEGEVSVLEDFAGDGFAHRHVLLSGLSSGSHPIGMVSGPDGRLFVGLGALEDHSGPSGRVISLSPGGGAPVLEATGLRTAYGLAFWGSRLLFTDNGPDNPGVSPDLLLAFDPSGGVVDFGFPKCYGQGGSACAAYPKPLVAFPSHSTPEGLVVKDDVAYVAIFGGPNVPGHPAPRSAIDSINLRTGHVSVFWRSPLPEDLVGLALGPDGNLYASGVVSGKVFRFNLA